MSEIPYYFDTPVPKYFRQQGLFQNQKNCAFVTWCFQRCSSEERVIFHDNKKITLKPYQFIFGRMICCEETGLTENEVRTQQERWESMDFLKKTTNKTTNRFTIYEWVLTAFLKVDHQQNNQQTTNKQPINNHNQEEKNLRSKDNHHPQTPLVSNPDDGLIDDDFSKNELIELCPGVSMTESMLNECIKIKGTIESVKESVTYIIIHADREIKNWPNALQKWKIPVKKKTKSEENREHAEELCKEYSEYHQGYRCYIHKDRQKDQECIVFESQHPNCAPISVWLSDGEFKIKCDKILIDRKIVKTEPLFKPITNNESQLVQFQSEIGRQLSLIGNMIVDKGE